MLFRSALNEEPHYRLAFASVEWVEELLCQPEAETQGLPPGA